MYRPRKTSLLQRSAVTEAVHIQISEFLDLGSDERARTSATPRSTSSRPCSEHVTSPTTELQLPPPSTNEGSGGNISFARSTSSGSSSSESEVELENGVPAGGTVVVRVVDKGPVAADDNLLAENVERLRNRAVQHPVISVRRRNWGGPPVGGAAPAAPAGPSTLFAGEVNGFAKFDPGSNSDSDSTSSASTSTNSDVPKKELERRRRRKIDRDFDQAELVMADMVDDDQGMGGIDEGDEDSVVEVDDSRSDEEARSTASSTEFHEGAAVEEGMATTEDVPRRRGFGAGRFGADSPQQMPPLQHPQRVQTSTASSRFSGVTFTSAAAGGCHMTMFILSSDRVQAVQGPCVLYGIHGETCADGFLLGKKQLHVEKRRAVVLQPLQRLATEASQLSAEAFEQLRDARLAQDTAKMCSSERFTPFANAGITDRCPQQSTTAGTAGVWGEQVDWLWVADTLSSWAPRLHSDSTASVVLVAQAYEPGKGMTRRVTVCQRPGYVERCRAASGQPTVVDVPTCFPRVSPCAVHPIAPSLMPVLRRAVSSAFSAAVVGGQGVGKSTLCRAFANAWLSQHGVCYWMDLDLGRPEFGVSGSLSVARVNSFLRKPNDFSSASLIKVVHVGGGRIHCPETVASAIAELCNFVLAHHGQWLRPLVINTHGWILSTGRRSTVEALRRLNPQHVIELARHGDPKWVLPEVLFDPKCGLNKRCVHERHKGGIAQFMPEADGLRNRNAQGGAPAAPAAANQGLHRGPAQIQSAVVPVVLQPASAPKAPILRRQNWQWLFRDVLLPAASTAERSSCVIDVELFGGNTIAALPHDGLVPVSVAEFCAAVAHTVVAVGVLELHGNQKKRPRSDGDSQGEGDGRLSPLEVLQPAAVFSLGNLSIITYGVVLTPSSEATKRRRLSLAVPVPEAAVAPLLACSAGRSTRRLVVLGCPNDASDTSFIRASLFGRRDEDKYATRQA